ncbi:hypothetical protein P43SY_011788 [Pythium insidiosum]|uniref:Transcription initiation factor TFIID subunit 2 n=1 Tax=Pythium insidiosum TaxID=114742 RepID=A0AAD5L973_PYTIN|nr:hypothetical protein P43SY_011788 [Pythium insidiosum]
MMRDYEYLQQRAFLRVELLERRVVGVAEVVLAPKASSLKIVRLHARQLRVRRVQVDGVDATFEQLDFLGEIVDEAYRDLATFDLFYRGAIVASIEGELIIQLPREVQITEVHDDDEEVEVEEEEDGDDDSEDDGAGGKRLKKKGAKGKRKRGASVDGKSKARADGKAKKRKKRKRKAGEEQEEGEEGEEEGAETEEDEDEDENENESADDAEDDDDGDGDGGSRLVLDKWDLDKLPKSSTGFRPMVVRVEYELDDPKGGLRFLLPDADQPTRSPHMYTHCGPFGGLCDGARTWMPCRDTIRDTCPFRLEITVPHWCVAVCSGQMVQQVVDDDGQYRSFRYVVNTKTNASSIGFAVGPFRLYAPPEMPRMTHFALPEHAEDLSYSTAKLTSSMEYIEQYLNARYPFKTYQQVFVEDPPDEMQYFAGLSLLDQNVLHSACIIDRELPAHLVQVKALLGSWIGGAIGIHTIKDAWVLIGVVGHLLNVYVRAVYGEEEHGYRIQLAMDALTTMELTTDRATPPALLSSEVDVYAEYDPSTVPFLEVKAPLVMHMIEQRVGPKHLRVAIQRVVSGAAGSDAAAAASASGSSGKDSGETKEDDAAALDKDEKRAAAAAGEDDEDKARAAAAASGSPSSTAATEPLSTLSFLKTVKAIAGAPGQDLTKAFLSTWIIEGGMPFFTVGYWYNRKQTQAEIVLQQEVPPGGKLFTGPITITIVEDTSEHPHQKRIEQKRHKWDFPCHSKVRKKRRKRQGLDDPDDSVSVSGPGMGLNDTPVYWVKVDMGCAWLRHVVMHQPDFNWMEQLLSDKKVGSRVHAARALALFHRPHEKPNVMSCRVLTECMSGLTTHSRRLRAEAALSLGLWQSIHAPLTNANTSLPIWKGMHNLFRIFKEHFFDRATDMPLPNYFLPSGGRVVLEALGADQGSLASKQIQIQDYAAGEYEIKKTIPKALALVRAQNGKSPPEIETFLLQLLCENDNSKNYVEMDDQSQVVDDCFFVGSILLSLSTLSMDRPLHSTTDKRVVREILRYLHYDQVQPSYGHTVTVCCLEALCNLALAGRCEENVVNFFEYATPKHRNVVRKAAIESIIRLFFAEDPNGPPAPGAASGSAATSGSSFRRTMPSTLSASAAAADSESLNLTNVYGPTAALLWVARLLQVEESPKIRLFAAQVCLNCFRGFPASVAAEVLATWDHSYTLATMMAIQMRDPAAFVLKSPERDSILACFTPPTLTKLRDDSTSARRVAEELWKLMNNVSGVDQRLRIALIVMYRKIWGETTPIAVAHTVQEKPPNWAGGYESLRLLMEESKSRALNGNRGSASSSGNGSSLPGARNDEIALKRSPPSLSASSTGTANLEHFRSKKLIKLKLGETPILRTKLG